MRPRRGPTFAGTRATLCGSGRMTRVIGLGPPSRHTPPMSEKRDPTAEGGKPLRAPAPLHVGQAAVDVRGLEPPHPMIRILELLDKLAPGQRLVVTHERRPLFLYPQLEDRGWSHETEELGPGEFRITIWREDPP